MCMQRPQFTFPSPAPLVVGSIGDAAALGGSTPVSLALQCDIAEIRLDLFHAEFHEKGSSLWQHLLPFPLLFTARCHAEGSPFELDLATREAMLRSAIPDACLIDIEAASASGMSGIISEIVSEGIPWVASYHDFEQLPSRQKLSTHAEIAREAGASAFKAAARLCTMDDLTALAHFQMSECGIPLSTMGMGVLAPVSRLLCAQAGSVLNYGFIGQSSTAPGQWSAQQLRDSIRSLNPFR
jgi:3-dehydroquinate dehydratase-1